MSEYLVNEAEIVQVADAIRAKSETAEPLIFPQGFVDAVSSIQSGGEDTLKILLDATKSCYYMFQNAKLTSFDGLIPFQSTSSVTDMRGMFLRCSSLTTIPSFDTSSVTYMNSMFYNCSSLTTIPLMDTSSVTDMSEMFYYCSSLTTIPSFDTSSVTGMSKMFYHCSSLTTIPLMDTSRVTSMYQMFYYCSSLTTIPSFDTSSVTDMINMFYNCSSLTTIPSLDTSSVTDMSDMFFECRNLTTIPLLDASSVTRMTRMFYNCFSLTTIQSLDISSVTRTDKMFYNCSSLTECGIRNIQTSLIVGSGSSYGHLLTVESLVHLINELRNVGSSRVLTVGSVNLEKLANVYVKTIEITDEMRAEDKFIDQKSPCVVCESTDEGATLIKDYAKTKNWTIQ